MNIETIKLPVQNNDILLNKYKSYNANNDIIMYHITSKKNAESILKNGFNIELAKRGAFGKGINLTTDMNHLHHYYSNKSNYIVVCKVKYNKRKLNSSGPEMIDKYTTKPKYDYPLKGYDALYVKGPEIYVIANTDQIYPVFICKVKFDI
jgi:hypothetical protein